MDVQGKAVIVTGASYGIGLATARLLAGRRARLALVARSGERLQELAAEIPGALALPADLSDLDAARDVVDRVQDRFGRVDVLINNAGQGYDAAIEKTDKVKFEYLLRLHVLAPLVMMQAVIPGMRARGEGVIVNVSSGASLMTLPNMGIYSATKRALNGVSLTAREELARDGIRVSVVYPFMTATNFEEGTAAFSDPSGLWARDPGGPARSPGSGGAAPPPEAPRPEAGRPEMPPLDPPELVAQKILEAIEGGEAELFAHEWMGRGGGS
jgi:short-subunit dehydrogenase